MTVTYIGLGANDGDRVYYIEHAIEKLREVDGVKLLKTASLYETTPWGKEDQPFFINTVCKLDVTLSPYELLKKCNQIENLLGRNRENEVHWGKRTIDLDILFFGENIINDHDLIIPHKYLHERAFVLIPLKEIAPNFVHPVLNKTVEQLLIELQSNEKVKLYDKK